MKTNRLFQVFLVMLFCLGSLGQAGQLVYSTFLGGSTTDVSYDIAIDNIGNAYITGYTRSSTDFPITSGVVDTTYNGGSYDIFVCKLSAGGSTLIYSTLLGGSRTDYAYGIALDTAGNAVITGYTDSSTDFPVTSGAFDTTLNGMGDAFVSKLNADGSALIFSVVLGGNSEDQGRSLALDSAGNIYIIGRTMSANFPITPGAIDSTFNDIIFDVFVSKLSADGSSLLYSTYLGGPSTIWGDYGNGIAVDNDGNAYITGITDCSSFPTTPGAFDTSYNGNGDVFVSKLNTTGTTLIYSTLLGGSGSDDAEDIALDNAGNVYITGNTSSPAFPITPGAFDTYYNSGGDIFISKLNADGSALVYSTFFGGSGNDRGMHIALDNKKCAYITGYTASSTNFPTTPTAISTTHNGLNDIFVSKFNGDGSALLYSTYLGGSNNDSGEGIAVDNAGNVYITGSTLSSDFPITLGAFDTTYNGSGDTFVSKLYIIPTAIDKSYWQDYQ